MRDECAELNMVSCGPGADAGCYNNLTQRCDGVKHCASGVDESACQPCPLICLADNQCYTHAQQCNGHVDCHDFSDEIDCGESPLYNCHSKICFDLSFENYDLGAC